MLSFDLSNIIMIVINLIVLVVIMRFVAVKPIRNIIKKREELINSQINDAETSKANAAALEAEWNNKLKDVDEESARLMDKAKSDAETEYGRLMDNARAEAEHIVDKARKAMDDEHTRIMESAQSEIAGLAIDITKKVLETSDLKGINDSLYEKFLTGDEDGSVGN